MQSCNSQPRSSDSNVDLEYAATLKDLREMTITEREYESPQEEPTFTFTFPSQPAPLIPNPRTSRSNSKTSQQEAKEKLVVFNDDVEGGEEREKMRRSTKRNNTSHLRTRPMQTKVSGMPILHSRSKSDPAVARARSATASHTAALARYDENGSRQAIIARLSGMIGAQETCEPGLTRGSASLEAYNTPYSKAYLADQAHSDGGGRLLDSMPSEQQHLIMRLRYISDQRTQLIEELQALHSEEHRILNHLGQLLPSINSTNTHIESHDDHASTFTQSLSALPLRTVSRPPTHHLAPLQNAKKAQKPLFFGRQLPRPISAPSKPTPLDTRHRTPSASKRVPLADKTDTSLTAYDTTPLHTRASRDPISADEKDEGADIMDTGQGEPLEKTQPTRGMSVQVPMKFGDEEEAEENKATEAERTPRRPRAGCGDWGTGRPGSKVRRARTPARTPRLSKYYDIPHTVVRTKWNF